MTAAASGRAPVAAALAELNALAAQFAQSADVCITCSDEGRIGVVLSPPASQFMPALVQSDRGEEEVDVTLVGEVKPGDRILIHAGGAIALLTQTDEDTE